MKNTTHNIIDKEVRAITFTVGEDPFSESYKAFPVVDQELNELDFFNITQASQKSGTQSIFKIKKNSQAGEIISKFKDYEGVEMSVNQAENIVKFMNHK